MTETRNCQNCKANFIIQQEDFDFYKKIDVPAPTFCPQCRMVRRMMFRNERTWYKATCAATGKKILSMFAPEKGYTVYEASYWRSDAWDPLNYGVDIDWQKPFFQQFRELFQKIPHPNLVQKNCVNSDYSNYSLNMKNCYFCASNDANEDSAYCFTLMLRNRQCIDAHMCTDGERLYEAVDCQKSSSLRFCEQCEGCVDSWLLYDCRNCTSCVGCVGLRSKQYCIFNEQYSKEEYAKKLRELKLNTFSGLQAAKERFVELKLSVPRKFAAIIKAEDAVGDDISESQDVSGFTIKNNSENVRYSYRINNGRDIWDGFIAWNGPELEYEFMACSGQRVIGGQVIYGGSDVYYSYNCFDCTNIFGCVGLRNKNYCIFNKQYSKEEYLELLPRLKQHMKEKPYRDQRGIIYGYGEFFPAELSPFAYNETVAQDYFPLSQAEAEEAGFRWQPDQAKTHQTTITPDKLPDDIAEVKDDILNEVIACAHAESDCHEQCAKAFKIIPLELQYYRQFGVPLPRLCPSCRHFQRVKQKPPLKLWHRQCMCNQAHSHEGRCSSQFQTPYAPERKEIVYCEQCYNAEVV